MPESRHEFRPCAFPAPKRRYIRHHRYGGFWTLVAWALAVIAGAGFVWITGQPGWWK